MRGCVVKTWCTVGDMLRFRDTAEPVTGALRRARHPESPSANERRKGARALPTQHNHLDPARGNASPTIAVVVVGFLVTSCCVGASPSTSSSPGGSGSKLRGPLFTLEPPHWLEFSNASGGEVRCEADGEPPPQLLWASVDGSPVTPVPGARILAEDGALVFPAFPADAYRQDVHAASYHCLASNELGTVASRDVHVSAGERTAPAPCPYSRGEKSGYISQVRKGCSLKLHGELFLV